jgi:hypothetical protein
LLVLKKTKSLLGENNFKQATYHGKRCQQTYNIGCQMPEHTAVCLMPLALPRSLCSFEKSKPAMHLEENVVVSSPVSKPPPSNKPQTCRLSTHFPDKTKVVAHGWFTL